ncbi:ester cyclase [Caulobacter sp.]|uniref:ester cyclase n=1 Tax=Caulobacter sp. TaxID=78 RepID=UPI002B483BD6|nr:ester cyclase [Caulobacter sp.]HJV40096.1 ester cyclase [Caulobacter sp.]
MSPEMNKAVVRRFNAEVIAQGDRTVFEALMAPDFVNHAAPPGAPTGAEGMWNTFQNVLRPALSDLQVIIHDQLGEGDKVTTRKTVTGVHTGPLMGVAATGKTVTIEVIDIIRLEGGRYVEHWGLNTLQATLDQLKRG